MELKRPRRTWDDLLPATQMAFMRAFTRIVDQLARDGYLVKRPVDIEERQTAVLPWMQAAAEVIMNAPRPRRKVKP